MTAPEKPIVGVIYCGSSNESVTIVTQEVGDGGRIGASAGARVLVYSIVAAMRNGAASTHDVTKSILSISTSEREFSQVYLYN
jgi:hypothetical protein